MCTIFFFNRPPPLKNNTNTRTYADVLWFLRRTNIPTDKKYSIFFIPSLVKKNISIPIHSVFAGYLKNTSIQICIYILVARY